MDIRGFFSRKRHGESSSDYPATTDSEDKTASEPEVTPSRKKACLSQAEKKKAYKASLSYRKDWEKEFPWVTCENPENGMFCVVCQEWGKPPVSARGAWTTRGITDWNHAKEQLKKHAGSQWHKDALLTSTLAKQAEGNSVVDTLLSAAAKQAAELRKKNRAVLLKLLRSVYFLAKNRIPHTTVFPNLIDLQVKNGDDLLEWHLKENAKNAQYTSKFGVGILLDAIDTWLEKKLLLCLKDSPCYSILADECQDTASQEEFSICFRMIVKGRPEEHFLTVLHVRATDAQAITDALTTYMQDKALDYRKLVGQGYDGAATFSGVHSGVQRRMRVHAPHALFIHCSCHRLQLASIQAAQSVVPVKRMFGTMTSLWKLFHYSPKKAERLKHVQSVLSLPELKIVKPSDTRWLSHERCIRAIVKELSALIVTLNHIYDDCGDAEAYGLCLALSSYCGVATVHLLAEVLDLLAKLNCFMQGKTTDFSRLRIVLDSILSELKELKDSKSDWCSKAQKCIESLETEQNIVVGTSSRNDIKTMSEFRERVACPYMDALVSNIKARFSDSAVALLTSASIFNPSVFPTTESSLLHHGNDELKTMLDFFGKEASVEYEGKTYSSPPLIDTDGVLSEWRIFKRAFSKEIQALRTRTEEVPTLLEVKSEMESQSGYKDLFPETLKLIDILLSLPVGTASVERSFSQMKLIKTRLRSRLNDSNLARLMRIAIEGPQLEDVNFGEILDIFKEKNRRIQF